MSPVKAKVRGWLEVSIAFGAAVAMGVGEKDGAGADRFGVSWTIRRVGAQPPAKRRAAAMGNRMCFKDMADILQTIFNF
jgi:hypothetical protein